MTLRYPESENAMRLAWWRLGLLFAVGSTLGIAACSGDDDAADDTDASGGRTPTGGSSEGGSNAGRGQGGGLAAAGAFADSTGGNAGAACDAELVLEADVMGKVIDELTGFVVEVNQGVAVACANMAADILGTSGAGGAGGAPLQNGADVCRETAEALQQLATTLVIEGGWCGAEADSLFECEGSCSGEACRESLEQRCPAESLAAECDTCEEGGACQGSAEAPAACVGACSGVCNGSCDGTCVMKPALPSEGCRGFCDGECRGTCTGICELSSSIECGPEVPCLGGCAALPERALCEAPVGPSSCDVSAGCQVACGSLASLRAACAPPKVVVLASSGAQIVETLEAHLPAIVHAAEGRGRLVLEAVSGGNLASFATSLADSIAADPNCLVDSEPQSVDRLRSVADTTAELNAVVETARAVLVAASADP